MVNSNVFLGAFFNNLKHFINVLAIYCHFYHLLAYFSLKFYYFNGFSLVFPLFFIPLIYA